MSSDKFLNTVQIPDVGETAIPSPESGFVGVIARNGILYGIRSDGTEFPLSGGSSIAGDVPVFIQDTQPLHTGKYTWIQTNIDNDPNSFTVWFEDGL